MPPRRRAAAALLEQNPSKIAVQILALQTIYYAAAIVMIFFTCVVMGQTFSTDLVLGWDAIRGDTTTGWMLGFVWLWDAFFLIIALLFLISRSKLVPDFALTLHGIHLLLVSLYSGSIPRNRLWWLLQVVSATFMTLGGIYACRWRELRPIIFGGATAAAVAEPPAGETGEDEEEGFTRGRGRGRGRDGAGNYEMVEMNGDGEVTTEK